MNKTKLRSNESTLVRFCEWAFRELFLDSHSAFLSQVHVQFTRTGFEDQYPTVGVRYMGVIDKKNLPYTVDFSKAKLEGLFLDYDKGAAAPHVTVLNPATAAASASGTSHTA